MQRIKLCILLIVMSLVTTTFAMTASAEDTMPYVYLGGDTIYLTYTNESFVTQGSVFSGLPGEVVKSNFNVVQIGETPILWSGDLKTALDQYEGQTVMVKELKQGQVISRKYEVPPSNYSDLFFSSMTTTGKASFYDPATGLGVSFSHPLNNNKISGIFYEAEAIGVYTNANDCLGVESRINDDAKPVGVVADQNIFGVSFRYNQDVINSNTRPLLQIARKNEVKCGDAYLYTNFGQGLKFYKVRITSTSPDFIDDYISPALSRYAFSIKLDDPNCSESGIETVIPGMSGSPVIKDGKILGFVAYSTPELGFCIYAEDSYNSLKLTSREKSLNVNLSSNPMVYVGKTPVQLFTKGYGVKIYNVEEGYGLNDGDIIIGMNNNLVTAGANWADKIVSLHEGTPTLKLTIIRDGQLVEVMLDENQNPNFNNFNNSFLQGSYISMVDEFTKRCACGTYHDLSQMSFDSGVIIDAELLGSMLAVSESNVIGSLDNTGLSFYGFLSEFEGTSIDKLYEIAFKDEIKEDTANLLFYFEEYDEYVDSVKVQIEKREDYLYLTLDSTSVYEFYEVNIPGLPIMQDGKLIGTFVTTVDDTHAIAYYAIDVYEEMMTY